MTKEEILNEYGCPEIPFHEQIVILYYPAILQAMEEYARIKCAEQRNICQQEFDKDSVQDENGKWYVSCEDVLNAKEPEL